MTDILYAYLYALLGAFIGCWFAALASAPGPDFLDIVGLAAILGPVTVFLIAGLREISQELKRPTPRWIHRSLVATFVAPMICLVASAVLEAAGAPWCARLAKGLAYASISVTLLAAACYGFWRTSRTPTIPPP